MDNVGHLPQSETVARHVESTQARRGRPGKDCARTENVVQEAAALVTVAAETIAVEAVTDETVPVEAVADETATRKRSLLLATLRVWELKHGIRE